MSSSDAFSRVARALTVAVMLAACGSNDSSGGSGNTGGTPGGTGGTPGMGGAEPDAPATPDVSAGGAGEAVDGSSDDAAPTDDVVDVVEEPVPCGAEKEVCCNDVSCTDTALTCSDSFCLSCSAIPSLSPGCVDMARGIVPTALQTSPNNPLVNATDGNACTAWGSGEFADIPDSGVLGTWWQLDLGSVMPIDSMTLWMAQTPPDAMVRLRIETSTDGTTWMPWQNPSDFTMLLHANDPWVTAFHDAQGRPVALRHLKITFLESPSWISIRELALFACPVDGGT
jgi:hypothetical protein